MEEDKNENQKPLTLLQKLDILITEKEVREYQEKKQKKLWAIVIKSLKEILRDFQLILCSNLIEMNLKT